MYGYGYKINSGLVAGAGGGAPFANTYSTQFDGIDDYVSTSSKITGSNITLSGWVNFNGSYSNFSVHYPLSITPSNTNAPNETLGRFYKDGSTLQIAIQCFDNTGANFSTYYVDNTTLEGAGWQHVCITYNVTTKHIYAYLNGVAQNWVKIFGASTPVPFLTAVSTRLYESDLTIGRVKPATSLGSFLGLVDEVSTYNRILTQEEITSIASAPTDLTSLSPNLWLRMGDNGSYKSPQWLIPNDENKDKLSNYSFELDGIDEYISVSDNSIGQTQNISYSIWVNLDVTTRQYIIGNQSSSNGGCGLQIENGDVLVFQMGDGGNDSFFNSRVANFSTYAPINTWNHILATWDGADSKIYINGILRNTWSPTLPYTISGFRATFNIGWRAAGFSFMTNGKLDELALFDSAVSIGDVWDGSGQPIDVSAVSGLTNNWRMGEDATFSTNWTIPDNVGNSNGTSNAMTIEDRVGDAPNSENNALSYNMDLVDRTTDVPT